MKKSTILLLSLSLLAAGKLEANDFPKIADTAFSSAPFRNAMVGALFVSLPEGATFYSRNPSVPLLPASNAKLATSAAALDYLKPDFRFTTSFLIQKKDAGRHKLSVLVWRGSGDPTISGRGHLSPYDIFELWGASLTALGISNIMRLVLDNRYFEDPVTVPSWPSRELSYWYAAQTSAISFNDNCVDLEFVPAPRPEHRAKIALTPDLGYVKAINRTNTGASESLFTLDYIRKPNTNTVTFFGSIPVGPSRFDYVSVHRPEFFAADTLRKILRKKNIFVGRAISWDKSGLRDNQLCPLFTWESEPLSRIVAVVNKNSQNLYAEQLLKTMGKEASGHGSFTAGAAVVSRFLERAGLAQADHHLVDGSGLSDENRITAAGLVRLLRFMHSTALFPVYYESLVIPGVDRAGRKRMKGAPANIVMRLKPGTVANARNLSGYLQSHGGKLYAFSVLVNGPHLDRQAVDEAVDQVCLEAVRLLP